MRIPIVIVVVLLLLWTPVETRAQALQGTEVDRAFAALDKRASEIVENYLRVDCEIGEVGAALKAVVQLGEVVKPYLTAVARGGPRTAVLDEFERGLETTWAARQEYLKTKDAQELGSQSFEMMKAITKEQYAKEQRDGLQAKYREQAAIALRALAPAR